MRVFLINLDRRPDRLAAMKSQLDRLGIAFERFSAVDARTMDPAELSVPFAESGPLGALSPGDKGCTYSHIHIWRMIAGRTGRICDSARRRHPDIRLGARIPSEQRLDPQRHRSGEA
jgi:GR25 family glycosyltransferase involved in LPS biosynthesis